MLTWKKEIIRNPKNMPYKSKKLNCWMGQVKITVEGEEYSFLETWPHWKRKKQDQSLFAYKKDASRFNGQKFKTKKAARSWERSHEDLVLGEIKAAIDTTFVEYAEQYLDQIEVTCTGENTYQYKQKLIVDLIDFYESAYQSDPPLPIPPLDIEQFLIQKAREDGPKTANRSRRELGTLFNWMIGKGIIDANPIKTISKFPAEKFKKYVPPKADILKIIAVANAEEKDILRTILHSMARAGEIRRMKKEHCDFKNNSLWLYTRKTAAGDLEGGKIPMNKPLREILYRRCKLVDDEYVFPGPKGGQLIRATMDKILPRLFKKVNCERDEIPTTVERKQGDGSVTQRVTKVEWVPLPEDEQIRPFGFHSIRHHVAAHLYLYCGYTIGQLQKLLRHKRPTTTEIYLQSIIDIEAPVGFDPMDDFETEAEEQKAMDNVHQFTGTGK